MKTILRFVLVLAVAAVALPALATGSAADFTVEDLAAAVGAPEAIELQGGNCLVQGPPRDCVCPLYYEPVCGCDGNTYSNECFARCEVKSWTAGACGSTI